MKRKQWTIEEKELLKEKYSTTDVNELADIFNTTRQKVAEAQKIIDYLYRDTTIYLDRKFEIFTQLSQQSA